MYSQIVGYKILHMFKISRLLLVLFTVSLYNLCLFKLSRKDIYVVDLSYFYSFLLYLL